MNAIAIFDPNSSFNPAKISGYITLHQCDNKSVTFMRFYLSGFKPNSTHAVHIHESGDLSKGCESLCAHYNPDKRLHGSRKLYGKNRHVGDLCNNITSDSKGVVDFEWTDELVSLHGKHSVIGRSIVIHEDSDDEGEFRGENTKIGIESGKTGNAGKRIACAIIGFASECN